MHFRSLLVASLAATALTASVSAQCLTTLYARNNGGSLGGAVYFDVGVTNPAGITITSLDTNTTETVPLTLDVYVTPATHVGNETNAGLWTMVASGAGVGQGANNPTPVDVTDFVLTQGQYGIALVMGSTAGHDYTNGNGSNQTYSNSDLTITTGTASNAPFTANIFNPRVWNGTLYYTAPGGVACASAGVFGTGCGTAPLTLSPNGTPSFGTTLPLDTTNVPAGTSIGAVALGLFEIMPPIDLTGAGAPGCFQYMTVDASLVWVPTGSTATANVIVPNNPAFAGVQILGQSVSLTPGINMMGVLTSNAVRLILGS